MGKESKGQRRGKKCKVENHVEKGKWGPLEKKE